PGQRPGPRPACPSVRRGWRGGRSRETCGGPPEVMRPLRVLTWHVHGNYLLYLSQANVEFCLPVAHGRPGFGGRGDTFPFPDRVREVPAEAVRELDLDCILFQSRRNY